MKQRNKLQVVVVAVLNQDNKRGGIFYFDLRYSSSETKICLGRRAKMKDEKLLGGRIWKLKILEIRLNKLHILSLQEMRF